MSSHQPSAYRTVRWLLLFSCLVSASVMAEETAERRESGSGYSIDWYTIDAGGELISNDPASGYEIGGTIAQPDAGRLLSGSGYELQGGFWSVAYGDDRIFRNGFELSQ